MDAFPICGDCTEGLLRNPSQILQTALFFSWLNCVSVTCAAGAHVVFTKYQSTVDFL